MRKKISDTFPAGIIDIGSHSARLDLFAAAPDGTIRLLESLDRPLNLGFDVFRNGAVSSQSIHQLSSVMGDFARKLDEYGAAARRVVATSAIREAFNQVHRYSKESFNSDNSLFKYIQVFVISNGTDSRYFANTVERNKNSFDFTMNWANAKNTVIKDLKDFTETFFQKNTLLNVIFTYSVFDTNNTLLVMRPYQIAATERILWKIRSAYHARKWSTTEGGGYVWHTTGSGKTLTSFKAARLATQLDFIDKVFFVVDRKDLDYQTMKEYQRFSPDSVNGSESTAGLKRNIEKDDNRIIVTTIQKLNNLMKSEDNLPVYQKQVVFIFDECHRSQFGEAQKQLKKKEWLYLYHHIYYQRYNIYVIRLPL